MDPETVRKLYDTLNGGPPHAFECLLSVSGVPYKLCGAVCKTQRGIRTHQWLVHRFKPQKQLFDKEITSHDRMREV